MKAYGVTASRLDLPSQTLLSVTGLAEVDCNWELLMANVKVKSSMTRSSLVKNLQLQFVGPIINNVLAAMLLKYPNGLLKDPNPNPVLVADRQLRTMALDTVGPIDWLLPPIPHRVIPPDRQLHGACRSQIKSVVSGRERVIFGTLGHRYTQCM